MSGPSRRAGRAAAAAAWVAAGAGCLLATLACPTPTPVPGEVVVGSFELSSVALVQNDCPFERAGDGGTEEEVLVDPAPFQATLSHDRDGRVAWLTAGATQLQGTWEGDRFVVSSAAEPRLLPRPCLCDGTLTETVEGRLFGEAQLEAGGCAVPPVGDAGLPLAPDGGLDARLVCGYITDRFAPGEGCDCAPCLVVYAIAGERQQ